jgi:glyoxylase-like metal-dependent hydrolase (beta-lactamase superfamily II)
MTRRNVVLSAAAAGAAFGLNKMVEIIPSASAQADIGPTAFNPKALKFHRFKVGDIEVTQVFDGAVVRDHSPGLVKNASVDDVKASLKALGLPDDKVPNPYTVTLVKIGDRQIMFDAGGGAGALPTTGNVTENAKAAGIDLSKLSTIVVSHFHPDHIFGLFTKENEAVYQNIEIIVPEAEYKYWADPAVIATLPEARQGIAKRVQTSMANWKNVKQVAGEKEVVPGVHALFTPGHTPGHTSYLLGSGNQQLIVVADVSVMPALNLRNPGWHIGFDHDAPLAEATRRKLFDRIVADKVIATGYHWGMPGAGTIAKDGGSYALQAVST